MSHTTAVKSIRITDIDALRSALAELNSSGVKCELRQGAAPRAFFASQQGLGVADYVIHLSESRYDIGLYKTEDGAYEARTDFWGGDVQKLLGATASSPATGEQAKMGALFQAYAVNAATNKAISEGRMVSRISQPDGSVQLVVTGF